MWSIAWIAWKHVTRPPVPKSAYDGSMGWKPTRMKTGGGFTRTVRWKWFRIWWIWIKLVFGLNGDPLKNMLRKDSDVLWMVYSFSLDDDLKDADATRNFFHTKVTFSHSHGPCWTLQRSTFQSFTDVDDFQKGKMSSHVASITLQKTKMAGWKITIYDRRYIFKWLFFIVILVFGGERYFLKELKATILLSTRNSDVILRTA